MRLVKLEAVTSTDAFAPGSTSELDIAIFTWAEAKFIQKKIPVNSVKKIFLMSEIFRMIKSVCKIIYYFMIYSIYFSHVVKTF